MDSFGGGILVYGVSNGLCTRRRKDAEKRKVNVYRYVFG